MGDIVHQRDVYDIVRALDPIAEAVEVRPAHWIVTPDGGSYYGDGGGEWCRACARAVLRHLRRRDRRHRHEYALDGGWVCEHDTPPHCAGCGVKLEATLLSYGALEELAHFRENPPSPDRPETVYEVREMLSALEYTKAENTKYALEAIAIGRKLVEQIGARHD